MVFRLMSSPEKIDLQLVDLNERFDLLEQVQALGRRYSQKLGHFPAGAFEDHARRGQILAALLGRVVAGYLVYRVTRRTNDASIVHLCVSAEHRGLGLGRALVEELKRRTMELWGIRLVCREDYPESRFWPRVGFTPIGERLGRNLDGRRLVVWRYEHELPPILKRIHAQRSDRRLRVALDSSVFYDLLDAPPDREETLALLDDWLEDEIVFVSTPALTNELIRQPPERRDRGWELHRRIFDPQQRQALDEDVELARQLIAQHLPAPRTQNDRADHEHLAHAAAVGATCLLTRDEPLLAQRETVAQHLGLDLLRPSDLIRSLDQMGDRARYAPARLGGSTLTFRHIGPGELDLLVQRFLNHGAGERKETWRERLGTFLSGVRRYDVRLVERAQAPALCLMVTEKGDRRLVLHELRVRDQRLQSTLAQQLLSDLVLETADAGLAVLVIPDARRVSLDPDLLLARGFLPSGDGYVRLCPTGAGPAEGLAEDLSSRLGTETDLEPVREYLRAISQGPLPETALLEVSNQLTPAVMLDERLPAAFIPIRPQYAAQLFDTDLARQSLFGAKPSLMFNVENVYFRSEQRSGVPEPPFHVLWYVSRDKGGRAVSAVRAISLADDVVVGPASEIYKRYERLGIYTWPEVQKTAKGSPKGHVMAIHFRNSTLLPRPLPLRELQRLLDMDARDNLPGPRQIEPASFALVLAACGIEVRP